jgi:hypothetical protein
VGLPFCANARISLNTGPGRTHLRLMGCLPLRYAFSRASRMLPSPAWLERDFKLRPFPGKQGAEGYLRRCPNWLAPT